jgi:molybdopterin synthase sulfur carrier subunit
VVTVRFWAGARRAAGHPEESLAAADIASLRADLARRPALRDVMTIAAFLVDASPATDSTTLYAGAVVDVLPPFAGG